MGGVGSAGTTPQNPTPAEVDVPGPEVPLGSRTTGGGKGVEGLQRDPPRVRLVGGAAHRVDQVWISAI